MSDVVDAFKRMAENSKKAYPLDPRDYVKDGLVFCFRCNERKQLKLDNGLIVNVACRCQKQAQNRIRDEQAAAIHNQKVQNIKNGNIPTRYHSWTIDQMDKSDSKMTKFVKSYVSKFDEIRSQGLNVCLGGKRGSGKTYFVAAIANALAEKEIAAKFMTFSELLNIAKEPFAEVKRTMMLCVTNPLLLIVDGFAVADWMDAKLLDSIRGIIETRLATGRPTLLTTSVSMKPTMMDSLNNLLAVIRESFTCVATSGIDFVKQTEQKNTKNIKELLGL